MAGGLGPYETQRRPAAGLPRDGVPRSQRAPHDERTPSRTNSPNVTRPVSRDMSRDVTHTEVEERREELNPSSPSVDSARQRREERE